MKMKGGEPIQANGRAGQGVHLRLETVPTREVGRHRTRAKKAITRKSRKFNGRKTIR